MRNPALLFLLDPLFLLIQHLPPPRLAAIQSIVISLGPLNLNRNNSIEFALQLRNLTLKLRNPILQSPFHLCLPHITEHTEHKYNCKQKYPPSHKYSPSNKPNSESLQTNLHYSSTPSYKATTQHRQAKRSPQGSRQCCHQTPTTASKYRTASK